MKYIFISFCLLIFVVIVVMLLILDGSLIKDDYSDICGTPTAHKIYCTRIDKFPDLPPLSF